MKKTSKDPSPEPGFTSLQRVDHHSPRAANRKGRRIERTTQYRMACEPPFSACANPPPTSIFEMGSKTGSEARGAIQPPKPSTSNAPGNAEECGGGAGRVRTAASQF